MVRCDGKMGAYNERLICEGKIGGMVERLG